MRKNRKNQKGIAHIALIGIIVASIGITVYLATQSRVFNFSGASDLPGEGGEFPASEVTTEVPAIENEADLQNTLDELENTNVDMINEMLFENDEDASSF